MANAAFIPSLPCKTMARGLELASSKPRLGAGLHRGRAPPRPGIMLPRPFSPAGWRLSRPPAAFLASGWGFRGRVVPQGQRCVARLGFQPVRSGSPKRIPPRVAPRREQSSHDPQVPFLRPRLGRRRSCTSCLEFIQRARSPKPVRHVLHDLQVAGETSKQPDAMQRDLHMPGRGPLTKSLCEQ